MSQASSSGLKGIRWARAKPATAVVPNSAAAPGRAAATRGPTSYTTLYTTERTLAAKPDVMLAMTRAIYRTQKWLHRQDAATIAATIASFFPDLDTDTLTACIARYKALDLWGRDPFLPKGGFETLKGACLSGGLIERGADYADCVDTSFARTVIESDPPSM